jgi:hypothetical protein
MLKYKMNKGFLQYFVFFLHTMLCVYKDFLINLYQSIKLKEKIIKNFLNFVFNKILNINLKKKVKGFVMIETIISVVFTISLAVVFVSIQKDLNKKIKDFYNGEMNKNYEEKL